MADDLTYNGWAGKGSRESAYATWRVRLELVDDDTPYHEQFDKKPDTADLADVIKDTVTEYVCGEDYNAEKLVTQYALAFLDDVSWHEIAETMLVDWPEDDDDEEENA